MTDQTTAQDPDVEADPDALEGAEGEGAAPKRRIAGKKLVLFVILPLFLIGMAGAGVYFSGLADPLIGGGENEEDMLAEGEQGPPVYYDVPEILVNLNTGGRKIGYLKLSVSLEVRSDEDVENLENVMPRIVDNFQVYLRELRVEDLSGSAGLQRLREELLMRVSSAAAPTVVRDVLFREMLFQ